jgi:hypothetical protein
MVTDCSPDLPIPSAIPVIGRLPRNWERAFGYRGDARWLVAWWEPAGDEARFADGRISKDAEWQYYLELVDGRLGMPLAIALADEERGRWVLGSSDEPATHCLLLDLQERRIFVAPIHDCRAFLAGQHGRTPEPRAEILEELTPDTVEKMLREVLDELHRETEVHLATSYRVCPAGCQHGWRRATDGGYDPCEVCHGDWLIPIRQNEQAAA